MQILSLWSNSHFKIQTIKNLALAGFFTLALCSCDLVSSRLKTKPVVQVEDQELTLQQFSKKLSQMLSALDPLSAKDPLIIKKFKNKIVSDYIVEALVNQWLLSNKLVVSENKLEEALKKIQSNYPDDKSFRQELAEQNLSYQDWKKQVEYQLKTKLLFTALREKTIEPTDQEIEQHFQINKRKYFVEESVVVESLLLADENQVDVVRGLLKKISFEEAFSTYSLEKNQFKAPAKIVIEKILDSEYESLFSAKIKKGDLVGPFKQDDGFRLYKVIEKKPSSQQSLSQVKHLIKEEIMSLRESAQFSSWLDEQIKKYKINKNTQLLDGIIVETRED